MTHAPNSISSLAIAGLIAVALGAAPIGLDDNFTPEIKSAFAKGGGNSGGGNSGGGNNGNQGGGHANNGNGNGFGHDKGIGNGHNKGLDAESTHTNGGSLASALGNLNAAHASPTALANANPDSMVGLIAIYAAAAMDMSPMGAQAALGAISNKSDELGLVDAEVVAEVNALLGDLENNGGKE